MLICITKTEDLIEAFNVINWTEVSRRFASENNIKYKLELGGTKRMLTLIE
jgi:hypothetical protein